MERCVRYAISKEEIHKALKRTNSPFSKKELDELVRESFLEVWEGLPDEYTFVEVADAGEHPAIRAEAPGIYVWVMRDGCIALKKNPKQILLALGNRRPDAIDFFSIVPAPVGLSIADAIALAKKRNEDGVPKTLEFLRERKDQEGKRK